MRTRDGSGHHVLIMLLAASLGYLLMPTAPVEAENASPGTSAHGSWTTAAATARWGNTATLLNNGKVLVAGGCLGDVNEQHPCVAPSTSAELYDPASGKWSKTGDMAAPRAFHQAALLANGKVLVFGGFHCLNFVIASGQCPAAPGAPSQLTRIGSPTAPTELAETFDPTTGKWTSTSPVVPTRVQALQGFGALLGRVSLTALPEGPASVCGAGCKKAVMVGQSVSEVYDPVADLWTAGPTPHPHLFHTATALAGGKIFLASGYSPNETYDLASTGWAPTGDKVIPTGLFTATRLGDGKVLAVGGEKSAGDVTGAAEVFDPEGPSDPKHPEMKGTWTPTAALAEPRFGHTAAALKDGKVLVVGGDRSEGAVIPPDARLASAEVYEPAAGKWFSAGNMAQPRGFSGSTGPGGVDLAVPFTSTTLADGRVLVVGGGIASADIYSPKGYKASAHPSPDGAGKGGGLNYVLVFGVGVALMGGLGLLVFKRRPRT